MGEKCIVDGSFLHCGVLRYPLECILSQLPRLESELKRLRRMQNLDTSIIRFTNYKSESPEVFFHQPFRYRLPYECRSNDASKIAAGGSNEWRNWLAIYPQLKHTTRNLWACWCFEDHLCVSLICGQTRYPSPTDYQLAVEPGCHRLTFTCSERLPYDARKCDERMSNVLSEASQDAFARFKTASGISVDIPYNKILHEGTLHVNPGSAEWLRAPSSINIKDLDVATCLHLFEKCVDSFTEGLGKPLYVEFAVDLDSKDPQTAHAFESIAHLPPVWSRFRGHWLPERFDIISTPQDPTAIRAYPLIRMESNARYPELLFQLNIVHVRGESFVECQVYEDKKWFDLISNFFDAPIDVWEGPIESRFGWYGDANTGRVVRHQTNTRIKLPALPTKNVAFVILPKYYEYVDGFFENEYYYRDPIAVFRTEKAAVKFAEKDPVAFTESNGFEVYTSQNTEFDFDEVEDEDQQKVREILEFKEEDDWREVFDECFSGGGFHELKGRSRAIWNKLFKLLQITPYRIIEVDVADKAAYEKLAECIKAGKFNMKIRRELAEQFKLSIGEYDYRGQE